MLNASCRDSTGPHCTVMLRSIAVLVTRSVPEDITMQAQESATVTLAGGGGAIWPNSNGHRETIA